jgi:hypothetical protein
MSYSDSNLPKQWVWMTCPSCNHSVSQPVGDMPGQFSPDNLRERGWCTVCGSIGCQTMMPSHLGGSLGEPPFDPDQSREAHLERMRRGDRLRYMVLDSQTLEVRGERMALAHDVVKAITLDGYKVLITSNWKSSNLSIFKDRARIGGVGVDDVSLSPEQRWFAIFARPHAVHRALYQPINQ